MLVVDENDVFLDSLTDWFDGTPEIQIVGRAHTKAEALQRTSAMDPDLVLIDTRLPDGSGFDAVRPIKTESASALVVMMSFHDSDHIRTTALSSGADDCITKADVPGRLASCVEALRGRKGSGRATDRIDKSAVGSARQGTRRTVAK